jgi:lysophospholipase L1-like esterase
MHSLTIFRKIIVFIRTQGLFCLALFLVIGLPLLWFWPQRGLVGKYYDNQEWRGEPVFTELDKRINLEAVSQRQETFPQRRISATWSGWIMIGRDGEYTFSTESDDGSSLFIDNDKVVENGGIHVARKASGKIALTKGLHSISINYFQGGGAYKLRVLWEKPKKAETEISPQYLYPRPFPLRGIGFLIRNLGILYPLSWLFLILVIVDRRVKREKNNITGVMKGYAQNISLTVIAVLVFVLVAEGVTRSVLYIREDRRDVKLLLKESKEADFEGGPRTYSLKGIVQESPYENIVYELKPNLKGNFRGVPLITNSRGLRDFEYSYRKPENTFRIVGLGDSSLFGWGVRMEDTSMKVLERELNQHSSSPNYEVINFATPGYNTAIEVEVFLKKCVKYDPDLVIMHFNTNDYDVPGFMKSPQSYSTFRKLYFLNFLYSRFQLLWGQQQQEMLPFVFDRTKTLEESDRLDEDPNFPDEYRHMVGKKGFLNAMDKLVQETKTRGIPLVVYVIKPYPGLDPSYTPNAFRDNQLKLITQLSQEKGFFLLNMYAAYINYLKEHPDEESKVMWVSEEDSHPSAVAHQVEAEALYEFLREHKLIGNSNG